MTETKPIRVVLVDDHTLFRKGLAELLEQRSAIRIVGNAANGDDALELLSVTERSEERRVGKEC